MSLTAFKTIVQQRPLNLPAAALLIAKTLAYPTLDCDHYLARIDQLAQEAALVVPTIGPLEQRGIALASFLFSSSGFKGDSAAYNDPRNSFLNEVIDRKLGIPITLSVLFLAVADRLGIPAHGVGLPGHFIVAVRKSPADRPLLLDPFNGGTRLTRSACARLVADTTGYGGNFLPQWLDPTLPLPILVRMLNNLRLGYFSRSDWEPAEAVIRLLQIVQPGAAEHLRDEGLLAYRSGDLPRAADLLERYLQKTPGAPDAKMIRDTIAPQLATWVRLN